MTFEEAKNQAEAEWEAFEKSEKPRILIGAATCGRSAGALDVLQTINDELAKHGIDAIVLQVGCIGLCYLEPLVNIIKPGRPCICYANITPEIAPRLVENYLIKDDPCPDLALGTIGDGDIDGIPRFHDLPMLKSQVRVILRNCGIIDPENINHYIIIGGYSGLDQAIRMGPEKIIEEIKESGLRGLGGAGFPTGRKWEACRRATSDEKYVICNADEGDPGAFQDRSVLEGDPHSVLEGMVIAGYAIGAQKGIIYVRAEYPLAVKRLQIAIDQARERKFLGKNILGSGFDFEISIFEGAGAFVCGESTALVLSIEGKRGMPKSMPRPRTTEVGLWDKPTLLNNVKTFASVPVVVLHGAESFASRGTEKSKGTAVFAITGNIANSGLVEVPMGTPLSTIIFDIGGGIQQGKQFKAVQTGGPSGGCIPASHLDVPVEFETLAQLGSIMGSGGMVVMDENTCMVDVARYFLDFTRRESCGQCVPCRVGTKQMLNILERITQGKGENSDIDKLQELAETVRDTSICALGGTASNPVLSTLRYFRDEYEEHIRNKRCPALACKELISYYILADKCQGCRICLRNCPSGAIKGDKRLVHVIDQSKCTKCGTCLDVCPSRFSAVIKVSGEEIEVPAEPIPISASE